MVVRSEYIGTFLALVVVGSLAAAFPRPLRSDGDQYRIEFGNEIHNFVFHHGVCEPDGPPKPPCEFADMVGPYEMIRAAKDLQELKREPKDIRTPASDWDRGGYYGGVFVHAQHEWILVRLAWMHKFNMVPVGMEP